MCTVVGTISEIKRLVVRRAGAFTPNQTSSTILTEVIIRLPWRGPHRWPHPSTQLTDSDYRNQSIRD